MKKKQFTLTVEKDCLVIPILTKTVKKIDNIVFAYANIEIEEEDEWWSKIKIVTPIDPRYLAEKVIPKIVEAIF